MAETATLPPPTEVPTPIAAGETGFPAIDAAPDVADAASPPTETPAAATEQDGVDDLIAPARRSNRVATLGIDQADGDTWTERIAVCEGATPEGGPKLLVRSYYRNGRTGQRVWDEPPSGASNIIHAAAEERKKADDQMRDLQFTLDMIPPEDEETAGGAATPAAGGGGDGQSVADGTPKKKKGLFARFRKNAGAGGTPNRNAAANKKNKRTVPNSQDLNLQRAIARSMADQQRAEAAAAGGVDPVIFFDPENPNVEVAAAIRGASSAGRGGAAATSQRAWNNEAAMRAAYEEDLEMAKALSISAAETGASQTPSNNGGTDLAMLSEEEMIARAIEESKLQAQMDSSKEGATATAEAPAPEAAAAANTLIDLAPAPAPVVPAPVPAPEPAGGDFWDQKMPAAAPAEPVPPAEEPKSVMTGSFDPYAPSDKADSAGQSAAVAEGEDLKQPPAAAEEQLLDLNETPAAAETTEEAAEEAAAPAQKKPGLGRRLFGGGSRKKLQDKAGVV